LPKLDRLVAAMLCAALACARKPAAAIPAPVVLDVGPSRQPDGVPRLQDAIDAAPAGALLRLAAGTFHGPLVISRPLTLVGQGAGRTVIEGGPADATVEVRTEQVELRGLSLSGGSTCLVIEGGAGHRLAEVELRGASAAGLVARGARVVFEGGAILEIGGGRSGRGIDLDGGSIEAKGIVFRAAGRRAVVLKAARGLFEDLDVRGPALSALQLTSRSEARVVRGRFQGLDGAALYAGPRGCRSKGQWWSRRSTERWAFVAPRCRCGAGRSPDIAWRASRWWDRTAPSARPPSLTAGAKVPSPSISPVGAPRWWWRTTGSGSPATSAST
jgi:hypothetical protein